LQEEQIALRGLYSRSAGKMESPEFLQQLASQSPTAYQAHLKFLQEQRKGKVDIELAEAGAGEKRAKTGEIKLDTKNKQRDFINRSLSEMSRNPSDANIIAFGEDAVLDGHLTAEQAKAKTQQLLAMSTPERQQYLSTQGLSNKDTAELFQSKPEEKTDGQTKWMQEGNPRLPTFGQRMTGAKPITMMPTPGEQLTASTAKAGQGVTMRGQNITAATAANRLAQEAQGVTYQQNAQGNIIAVPSKLAPGVAPVARPVTGEAGVLVKGKDSTKTAVSEQQAAYNIGRVLTAANEIKNISSTDPSSVQPGAAEALAASVGMGGTANLARSANRQIVQGAQRDALDALLYLATGAAYNKEQLQGQMEAYIPAYTDKPPQLAAKKTRMTELIKSAKIRAGNAWTPEMDTALKSLMAPAGAATPAAGGATGEWKVVK